MRGLVALQTSGLQEFIDEMEGFVAAFPECSRIALAAQEDFVVEKIRQNWVSFVPNAKVGDFVYSCIGKSTELSNINTYSVVGTVGVYKLDAVNAAFGKEPYINKKGKKVIPMSAAQLAYWIEFGTTRLNSGLKKKVGATYSEDEVTPTVKPRLFMTNAMYSTINEQEEVFKKAFKIAMDQFNYSGA